MQLTIILKQESKYNVNAGAIAQDYSTMLTKKVKHSLYKFSGSHESPLSSACD
jgi:hypothetical protein